VHNEIDNNVADDGSVSIRMWQSRPRRSAAQDSRLPGHQLSSLTKGKTMELKRLQHEILEAERLIERNKIILALNDQVVTAQKEIDRLTAENTDLKEQLKSTATE
jgi:hypothetical protein